LQLSGAGYLIWNVGHGLGETPMKRFWIGFGLGIAATIIGVMLLWGVAFLLGCFGIGGLQYVGSGHAPSAQQTNNAGNLSVTFGGELGRQVVFTRTNDTFTFTPPASETCEDAIVSPDGKIALLLMRTVLDFGYDYSCVMRFDFGAEPLAQARSQRILSLHELNTFLGGNQSWVNEMYKFSPSGDRILVGVSTMPSGRFRRAYWYNLASNVLEEP